MKNAGGFLIGAGLSLLVGYGIWKAIGKNKVTETGDEGVKPPPGGSGNTGGSGSGGSGNTGTPPPNQTSYKGKKVADVLKTTPQSKLANMPVYTLTDNVQVYTTVNTPYTKAAKGQLIGYFAGATVAPAGGYMVNLKTQDPQNKYVKAYDALLKF